MSYKLEISEQEFQKLKTLIYDHFGICLSDQKKTLVVSRLQKTVRALGLSSFSDYYEKLDSGKNSEMMTELINLISTNHTYFGREADHFNFLSELVLPELEAKCKAANSKDIRIWSAGCSSGEEPYTISMLLMEHFKTDYPSWKAGVLATDISTDILTKAMKAHYNNEQVDKLDKSLKSKYMRKVDDENWTFDKKVLNDVIFRRFNLMSETFPFKQKFHVIFCRNVMIYFDQETRNKLVEKFWKCLEPGGYLLIGHSESLGRDTEHFEYIKPATYRKKQ